jgi:transcriptional regulator with XRE-family HTH domain
MQSINKIISRRRKQIGMTKLELAHKSGVSRATVLLVERDDRQPAFNNAVALLEAMGLRLSVTPKKI